MANSSRNILDAATDNLTSSQGLNQLIQRERESEADRISIWWVSIGMIMVFLSLGLLMVQVELSKPKTSHPIESAWY
ncbi:MAG TPA: hypothetical protein VJR03_14010 [Nitrospira sp.]|nr:hypothetical protein [Nitrospira sp.]